MAISKFDDVIDSREIIERIEELEDTLGEFRAASNVEEDADDYGATSSEDGKVDLSSEAEELVILKALVEELRTVDGDSPEDGLALVRDSYFTAYVVELLEDIGDLPKNLPVYIEIDWEATARNIQMDYTSVEFDGVTYWVR